jgi:hypothetical protein
MANKPGTKKPSPKTGAAKKAAPAKPKLTGNDLNLEGKKVAAAKPKLKGSDLNLED